jgi:hypothetical protein
VKLEKKNGHELEEIKKLKEKMKNLEGKFSESEPGKNYA